MKNAVPVPWQVEKVISTLEQNGYMAYLVGGALRDLMLGRVASDYDVATSARPEETERVFAGEKIIETGLKHGTVTVLIDWLPIEITTFRVDGPYADGRHPDSVAFTPDVREDLARRDFTMNAIAYSPREGFVDPFGGEKDIEDGMIRCVGDPLRRFEEDGLRVMRAVRFASELGFEVEPKTAAAVHSESGMLERVSAERIAVELNKTLVGDGAGRVLEEFSDVFCRFIPELEPCIGFDQMNPHHCFDVFTHAVHAACAAPPKKDLRLAALLHDVGKPRCFTVDESGTGHFYGHAAVSEQIARGVLRRLKYDNETVRTVTTLIKYHSYQPEPNERSVRRALNKLGAETFFDLLDLKRADNRAQAPEYLYRQGDFDELERIAREIIAKDECFSLKDLAVGGRDLIEAGCPEGPEVGRGLEALLGLVIDGALPNEKEALIGYYEVNLLKN